MKKQNLFSALIAIIAFVGMPALADSGTFKGHGVWTQKDLIAPYQIEVQKAEVAKGEVNIKETITWDENGEAKTHVTELTIKCAGDGKPADVIVGGKVVGHASCNQEKHKFWANSEIDGVKVFFKGKWCPETHQIFREGRMMSKDMKAHFFDVIGPVQAR